MSGAGGAVQARCGATNRRGEACQGLAMTNGRCKNHGGKTPGGAASPNFKTGRYSKYLPARLLDRYEQALTDPDLLAMHDEIALIDARLGDMVGRDESSDAWSEIQLLIEQRRKLVESERKRLLDLQQMLSAGEAVAMITQVLDIVRRHVTDRSTLDAIGREFTVLLNRDARPRLPDAAP